MRGADNLVSCMCRPSRKSGSLDVLEPYGPAQARIGLAVPLASPLRAPNKGPVASAAIQLTVVYVEKIAYAIKGKHTDGK